MEYSSVLTRDLKEPRLVADFLLTEREREREREREYSREGKWGN